MFNYSLTHSHLFAYPHIPTYSSNFAHSSTLSSSSSAHSRSHSASFAALTTPCTASRQSLQSMGLLWTLMPVDTQHRFVCSHLPCMLTHGQRVCFQPGPTVAVARSRTPCASSSLFFRHGPHATTTLDMGSYPAALPQYDSCLQHASAHAHCGCSIDDGRAPIGIECEY